MAKRTPTTIDGATGKPDPSPRRVRLETMTDIKREMARVYREARGGRLNLSDAGKLTFMLTQIGRTIEGSDIERRLRALEDHHEQNET